jgi:hypothetical protein
MFEFFPHSFGVANINNFISDLTHPPKFVTQSRGGAGFKEIADQIIQKLN